MLEIYRTQRLYQIENGPFSESFEVVETGDTFKGIFDRSHREEGNDSGNVSRKTVATHIMVATIPEALEGQGRTVTIKRVDTGVVYKYNKSALDTEGIPILWLV